jgi:hypothetical protein
VNDYDDLVEELGQQSPTSEYDQIIRETADAGRRQLQTAAAAPTTPDRRAEALTLSERFKVPADVIERNWDVFQAKRDEDLGEWDQIIRQAPGVASFLREKPEVVPAVKDDLPSMVKLDNALTFGAAILRGVDSQLQAGTGRFLEATGEAVGSTRLASYGREVAEFNEQQAAALGKRTDPWEVLDSGNPWTFMQLVKETLGEQIPVMATISASAYAGAAIGAPLGPAGATIGGLVGAFLPALAMGVGETQGAVKAIDPDAEPSAAVWIGGSAIAALDTAVPGGIGSRLVRAFGRETAEQVAKRVLLAPVKPRFVRSVAGSTVSGFASEGVTEAVQEAIGAVAASTGTGTDMDWSQTFRQMAEAGFAGALVGGTFSAGTAALANPRERAQWAAAQQQQAFFEQLAGVATESKLAQRSPSLFRDVVASATKDGPVANVYVDPHEFTTYWQGKDVSPEVMAKELTGSDTALQEAIDSGTKLAIPTADYAAKLAATEHHAFFAKELTLDPEGLSAREAKVMEKVLEEQAAIMAKAAEDAQAGVETPAVPSPIREAVQGVDVQEAARTYAAGVEAVFTTLGTRLRQDPVALFGRFGLTFGNPAPGGGPLGTAATAPAAAGPAPGPESDPGEIELGADEELLTQRAKPRLPSLQLAPARVANGRMVISTRVPTSVDAAATEDLLRTDLAVVLQAPDFAEKVAAKVAGYAQVTQAEAEQSPSYVELTKKGTERARVGTPEKVLEAFIQRGVRNLRFLWQHMPAETRDRAKLWYVGAHRIARDLADTYGYSDQQAAAILAVLSPKTDWFKNVAYARALAKFHKQAVAEDLEFTPQLFTHMRARVLESFTRESGKKIRREQGDEAYRKARNEKLAELRGLKKEHEGKRWSDLSPDGRARLARAYIEVNEPLSYPVILPEGENGDTVYTSGKTPRPARMGWTSYDITATALALMDNGSPETIQDAVGGEHKVRSFFNNISDPWDPNSVTIDTHAVAAAHLEPFSSESPEVKYTMGQVGNALTGLSGANAIYAEMYFRLAAELSAETGQLVLPREVQSVTWEAVRGLFEAKQKTKTAAIVVKNLWSEVRSGKLSEEQLYARLLTTFAGVTAPAWADHPPRLAFDESRLREGDELPLRPDVPARRRNRSARAAGARRSNAHLPDGLVRGETTLAQPGLEPPAIVQPADVATRRSSVTRALDRASDAGLRVYSAGSRGRDQGVRGVAAVYRPEQEWALQLQAAGYLAPTLHELAATPENAAAFRSKLLAIKASNKFGAAVYVYEQADYEAMRLFVSEDGKSGFAIKHDGDIVSVFSGGGGVVHSLLALAVAEGGTKLDCFDTVLPHLYSVNGFKVVSRDSWNDAYAPEGWDAETFGAFNGGKPDVVYMQYDPAALKTGPVTLYQGAPAQTGRQWAYSRLTRAVELSQLAKASGAQWKATIKNSKLGINQDEFLFANVTDLEDGTVYSKQAVLDYLATNALRVEWTELREFVLDRNALTEEQERVRLDLVEARLREEQDEFDEWAADALPSGRIEEIAPDEEDGDTIYRAIAGDGEELGDFTDEAAAQDAIFKADDFTRDRAWRNFTQTIAAQIDDDVVHDMARENLEERAADEGDGLVQFQDYQLDAARADPGSYREVFLTAPQFKATGYAALTTEENALLAKTTYVGAAANGHLEEAIQTARRIAGASSNSAVRMENLTALAILEKLRASGDTVFRNPTWVDGHVNYSAIDNPIVRLRYNTRTLPDGRKVLFLEEVQPPQPNQFARMPELLQKNWRELAFKWALDQAAQLGVDAVAWTSGQMQAERYSLSKQVKSIEWRGITEGTPRHETGVRRLVSLDLADRASVQLFIDEAGLVRETRNGQPDWVGQGLDAIIGKELARQIIEGAEEGVVKDAALDIGGEGLKRLYDVDFRNVVNKLQVVKKAGAKVGTVPVPAGAPRIRGAIVTREDLVAYAANQESTGDPELDMNVRQFVRQLVYRNDHPSYREPVGTALMRAVMAGDQTATTLMTALGREVLPQTEDVPGVEITPAIRSALDAGQALFQGERGLIRFGADRQFNVQLLAGADLSTVLHEMGHFYLEVVGDLVAEFRTADPLTLEPGQRQLRDDYETILKFLGVTDRTQVGVEQHEQFARAFEAYLMEGKAPTAQLRGAFARFRAWMVSVYKNATQLSVTLTPEVRAVFDRLVATDDAIEAARSEANIAPFFATAEEAGMSQADFARYQRLLERTNQQAREQVEQRVLEQLTRERKAWWKTRKAQVRTEVAAQLAQQPIYQALAQLQGENGLKLSKDSIVAKYGKERLATLPKPWVYSVEDGLDVDHAAEVFGFTSGDQLLTALAGATKFDDAVEAETTRRMKAEHGDMLNDGTLRAQAKREVQENGRDEVLTMELKALQRKAREIAPFARAAAAEAKATERARGDYNTETERASRKQAEAEEASSRRAFQAAMKTLAPLATVRAAAEARIARTRLRDIRPNVFWAAAKHAGEAATEYAASGRYELAFDEKQKQRMATELYRAAERALEQQQKALRYAQRFDQTAVRSRIGLAGESYLQQIDALLGKFEFRTVPLTQLEKRASLLEWVKQQQDAGLSVDNIPAEVLEAAQQQNYRTLTPEQLSQVIDAVRQIEHLARVKNRLLANKESRAYKAAVAEIEAQLATLPAKKQPIEFRRAAERQHTIAEWFASHKKIATLARALDGYAENGPIWRYIIRPLNEAADAEVTRRQAEGQRFNAIVAKHYPGRELAKWGTLLHIPAISNSLTLEGRLAVALNWGNETSRERLLNDPVRRWTEPQVNAILETLDARDWRFVQETWDYVDSFWPEISDKQQRVTGLRPEKVEAIPVITKHGVFRGGYYPLAYEGRLAARAGQVQAASEAKLQMQAAYVRTTTRRGHVETRLEHVGLPVKLDLGVMFAHVDQVVHDLTHHEVLIDVARLLRDRTVSQAIIDHAGQPVYKQFTNAITAIAVNGRSAGISPMDRGATWMRHGLQVAQLGLNLWTALQQPLGLFNGAERVGARYMARGLKRFVRDAAHMESTAQWIYSVSPMMRHRGNTATQDLADLQRALKEPGGWFDTLLRTVTRDHLTKTGLTDAYLWHIGAMQRVADIPTWLGGYEKAMDSGVDEETAFRLADQAVLDSQGGGQIKDLADIQRGTPVAKLFMVFYSYGSTVYNSTAAAYGRTSFRSPTSVAKFLTSLSLLYVLPAAGSVTLRRMFRPSDDDDDSFLVDVAQESLSAALNGIVLVRELSGLVGDGVRGYAGPAGTRALQTFYALGQQVMQGEADEAAWKKLNEAAGIIFRYPSAQAQRTVDGFVALQEGRTSNPLVLLFGAPQQ